MTADPSAERIRQLRLERQSLEWDIEQCGDECVPEFLCAEREKVCEDLLVALDDRAEKI